VDIGQLTLGIRQWTGQWTVDTGRWAVESGHWTLDSGQWTVSIGQLTLDGGQWTVDTHCLCSCVHEKSSGTEWKTTEWDSLVQKETKIPPYNRV